MNREQECLALLKEPVRHKIKGWDLIISYRIRPIYKNFGGKNRGRWVLFKSEEFALYKPFNDALIATLCAKNLLTKFSENSNRAFFLKTLVPKTPYKCIDTLKVYRKS